METVNSSNTVTLVEIKHSLIPKKWGETVRIVDMSECQQVAISLAHAFAADDLACYLLNSDDMAGLSPEEKWKLHVDIFQYIVAAHCLNGETHVIGPDHEGVALWSVFPLRPGKSPCPVLPYLSIPLPLIWNLDIIMISNDLSRMPPGKNIDDWYTVLRSGMWRLYFQLSSEGRQRYYNELLPLLHDTKVEVLGERDENAYYLVYLGTKPHARGRGYARKLLQTMIARVRSWPLSGMMRPIC